MDRHATLWLSEACGGTRLGACGRCVIRSAVCRWRASAKQSENSEHSEHSGWLADARAVVSRSWLSSSPPWRRWDVVCSGTACHHLRGVDIYVSSSSGYVADTPVGSIPGYAQLPPPPGWRITSPLVVISVKARAAAMHFRVIRLIRVLDCFTRHCLCTALRDSRVPLTGCDLKWENHRTRSARAACLVSMVCAEDCTFWVMKWCFSAKREGFLACFFFLVS